MMIEVFTTNLLSQIETDRVLKILENYFPDLKINFDLEDIDFTFPCGHSILRIEGDKIPSANIISIVNESGFLCTILEDKICK